MYVVLFTVFYMYKPVDTLVVIFERKKKNRVDKAVQKMIENTGNKQFDGILNRRNNRFNMYIKGPGQHYKVTETWIKIGKDVDVDSNSKVCFSSCVSGLFKISRIPYTCGVNNNICT